jgi:anti-sigma factor RsiW
VSHLDDLLSAYLDGELEDAARHEVAAHLDECGACRIELAQAAEARMALRNLPQLEAPPALFGRERAAIRGRVRFFRPVWGWAAAGAAALALTIGLVAGPGEPEQTIDLDTFAERHTARVVFEPGIATVRAVVEGP